MPFQMSNMVRFALLGQWSNGRPVLNMLDMHVIIRDTEPIPPTPPTPTSRVEAIEITAGDIADNWADHLVPYMTSAYTFTGVSWVDLDSASGSTGFRAPSDGPAVGGLGGDSMPPQNTLLITKVEGSRTRGTRPGRWYLSAVRDSDIDNNGLVRPEWRTQMDLQLEKFRSGVEDQGIDNEVWTVPVVIHESAATANEITKFTTSQKIGKQGRRYDGRA